MQSTGHAFAHRWKARRRNRGSCRVAGNFQTWEIGGIRQERARKRGILHMDRVELAVAGIVGIELNPD